MVKRENISKSFRVSPLIIGVTIVALGTSLPELAVSTVAILKHDVGLAFGNIIGSNIANILLVFPVGILLGKLRVGTTKTQKNALLVLLVTGLFALLHFLHFPPFFSGLLLTSLSLITTVLQYHWGKCKKCSRANNPVTNSTRRAFFWVLVVPTRSFPRRIPTGKTSKILAILEPIMFPKASPTSCFRIATVDTASSGSEVPRATIVTPIINGETRKDLEMFSRFTIDY